MDAMLIVSNLHSETKGSWFESGCYMCAEVNMRRLAFCSNRLANVKVLVKRTEVVVRSQVGVKNAPPPLPPTFPVILWFVNACERKSREK